MDISFIVDDVVLVAVADYSAPAAVHFTNGYLYVIC